MGWRLNDVPDIKKTNYLEVEYTNIGRFDGGKLTLLPAFNYFRQISKKAYLFVGYDFRSLDNGYFFTGSSMSGNIVLGNYFKDVLPHFSVFGAVSLPDTDDTRGLGTDAIDFSIWGILKKSISKRVSFRGAVGFGIWGRSDLNNKSYLLDKDDLVLGERRIMFGPSSIHGTVNGASGQEDVILYDAILKYKKNKLELYTGIDGFTNGVFYQNISQGKIGLKYYISQLNGIDTMYSTDLLEDSMKNSFRIKYFHSF